MSLRGTPIDNDSFVDVDDIGNSDSVNNGLLCLTNDTNCCTGDLTPAGIGGLGQWLFPNRTGVATVVSLVGGTGFGRDRAQSVVRLFRFNNPSERGRFSCALLGDTIYANVCE